MVNRFERKNVVFVLAVVAAASVLCFGPVTVNAPMVLGGFVLTMALRAMALRAMVAALYTCVPEPPDVALGRGFGHRRRARHEPAT